MGWARLADVRMGSAAASWRPWISPPPPRCLSLVLSSSSSKCPADGGCRFSPPPPGSWWLDGRGRAMPSLGNDRGRPGSPRHLSAPRYATLKKVAGVPFTRLTRSKVPNTHTQHGTPSLNDVCVCHPPPAMYLSPPPRLFAKHADPPPLPPIPAPAHLPPCTLYLPFPFFKRRASLLASRRRGSAPRSAESSRCSCPSPTSTSSASSSSSSGRRPPSC